MNHFFQRLREEAHQPWQLTRRFGLRTAVLLLILSAILVPSCQLKGGEEQLAVLVDLSGSISLTSVGSALTAIEQQPPDHILGFAQRAVQTADVEALRNVQLLDHAASGARRATADKNALSRDQSNLETALRSALDLLPTDGSGRILLLSDGNATEGSAPLAADIAKTRRVRVDTLPLGMARQPPRITGVELPTSIAVGHLQRAAISIASSVPDTMILEIRVGEQVTESIPVIHPGLAIPDGLLTISQPLKFEREGDRPLALRLLPGNDQSIVSKSSPSRWRSTVRVSAKPKVLFVDSGVQTPLYRALEDRGLNLRRVSPRGVPATIEGLSSYRSVVLHDIDANNLGIPRMEAIARWVRAGGSLFFASGESSYGEGGYNETAIADVLPATFEVREEKADVALMIALDKSYSMKGDKMDLAKEATKAALGELDDEHRFGLVAFDWNTFNIVPLQSVANRDDIREQISKIEASAQTNFYPALESCFRQLDAIDDPTGKTVKHVILVSDGKTYPDDYEGLVRRMYDADITLSTVAVGLESDVELLQQIAEWGHGRSYFVQDASRVQKILLDEARSKLEDTLIEEDTRVRVRGSHPVLQGIDFSNAPPLAGYVSYRARGGTEVLLETGDGQPILARRRIDAGETWLWASDLSDRWSASWLQWNGFLPLISQVLHSSVQGAFSDAHRFTVRRTGHSVELVAQLQHAEETFPLSSKPLDGAVVSVNIGGAAAEDARQLHQVAPGEYSTTVDLEADPSGDIRFELVVDGKPVALRSLYFPGTDELLPGQVDQAHLSQLASMTNGTSWNADEIPEALSRRPQEVHRTILLWRWFLLLAGLIYLVELALHRLGRLDPPFDPAA